MTRPGPLAGPAADELSVFVDEDCCAVPFADPAVTRTPYAGDLRAAFERVVARSQGIDGEEVVRFEQALADHVGTAFVVGVGSGTAALMLTLLGAGIGPGDEVILPAYGPFATIAAVLAAGATPVLAEVDVAHGLLDPLAVEAVLSPCTSAIVSVHLYGQPAPMDVFHHIAERHGLLLLEDATQAMAATWNGRPAGSLGHAAAFSFRPGSTLSALGEAGAVATGDVQLAGAIGSLRDLGRGSGDVHVRKGFNERLDALQAAFLSAALPHLSENQRLRHQAVARYRGMLATADDVEFLDVDPRADPAYQLLVLRVPRRDQVLGAIRATGIEARIHYPTPIHLQPACADLGYRTGQFPNAEVLGASVLSLPLYPGITPQQVDRSAEALKRALSVTA